MIDISKPETWSPNLRRMAMKAHIGQQKLSTMQIQRLTATGLAAIIDGRLTLLLKVSDALAAIRRKGLVK